MLLQVQDVLLLRHSDTGNPRGAFTEFPGAQELEGALQLDGQVPQPLQTNLSSPSPLSTTRASYLTATAARGFRKSVAVSLLGV